MKKTAFLLSLFILSSACQADGWTGELSVASAFTEAKTDLLVVYTSGGSGYTPGCSVNAWIFTADTAARGNRGYATVLAALATGKKIKFWYRDSCAIWSFHEATSVMLVN